MSADFSARALALAGACAGGIEVHSAVAEFRELIETLGLVHSVCGAWTGVSAHRVHRFFFNDWPEDWLALYNERQIFADDPFVEEARRSMTLYLWSEVETRRPLTPRAQAVYDVGRAYGWREVVGVPIHGPMGYQGLVSLASFEAVTFSPQERACLDLISRAIHERCRREIGFGLVSEDMPKLTAREIECMQWVAVGKTDWEIAQVLGISRSTAHFHIEGAKRKLGSSSRSECVTRLALYGLI